MISIIADLNALEFKVVCSNLSTKIKPNYWLLLHLIFKSYYD